MDKTIDRALVWFRRDLRTADHAALYHALKAARQVWCAFVYDRDILDPLPRADRRVEFIVQSVDALDRDLAALGERHGVAGVRLLARHGPGAETIVALADQLRVQAVYANHDDDPYALARDAKVRGALADAGVALHTSKDHVVFERNEVLTGSGKPYSVFTPYKTAWLAKLDDFFVRPYGVERHAAALAPVLADVDTALPTLERIGFVKTNLDALKIHGGTADVPQIVVFNKIDRMAETERPRALADTMEIDAAPVPRVFVSAVTGEGLPLLRERWDPLESTCRHASLSIL